MIKHGYKSFMKCLERFFVMKWHYISIVFPLRSVKVQALSIRRHSQWLTHPSCSGIHHQSFPLQEKFRSVYVSSMWVNITIVFECLINRNIKKWLNKWTLFITTLQKISEIHFSFSFFPSVCISVLSLFCYRKQVWFRLSSNDPIIWDLHCFDNMFTVYFFNFVKCKSVKKSGSLINRNFK